MSQLTSKANRIALHSFQVSLWTRGKLELQIPSVQWGNSSRKTKIKPNWKTLTRPRVLCVRLRGSCCAAISVIKVFILRATFQLSSNLQGQLSHTLFIAVLQWKCHNSHIFILMQNQCLVFLVEWKACQNKAAFDKLNFYFLEVWDFHLTAALCTCWHELLLTGSRIESVNGLFSAGNGFALSVGTCYCLRWSTTANLKPKQ